MAVASAEDRQGSDTEILHLIALGENSRQIAKDLVVGRSPVESHVQRIIEQLDVINRIQASAKEPGLLSSQT